MHCMTSVALLPKYLWGSRARRVGSWSAGCRDSQPMDPSAEAGAAFHEFGFDASIGPVPNDDFEETDGVQVFCPISAEEEDMAADFLGAPPSPRGRPAREPNSPLRSPPDTMLPLACNAEIAEPGPRASL